MPSSADPSRIGGEPSGEFLRRVERCEEILRGFGFRQFRIRARGATARIEARPEEIPRLFDPDVADAVHEGFRRNGFLYVSVDLEGTLEGPANGGGLAGGPPDPELL
jgi:uncharacterized protein